MNIESKRLKEEIENNQREIKKKFKKENDTINELDKLDKEIKKNHEIIYSGISSVKAGNQNIQYRNIHELVKVNQFLLNKRAKLKSKLNSIETGKKEDNGFKKIPFYYSFQIRA